MLLLFIILKIKRINNRDDNLFSSFQEPVELEEIGDEQNGISFKEANLMPIMIMMDIDVHRPKEFDFEEFSSYLDVSWQMTFIDLDHSHQ